MESPPPAVTVRSATEADFPAVAALLAELGRPMLTSNTSAGALAVYRRYLARATTAAQVAESDGVVVGFLSLEFRDRLNRVQPQAWVPDLIVTASHRRRGIGRALLLRGIALAEANGCWSLILESGRNRDAAHRLYRSVGLVDEGYYFIRSW